MEWKEIDLVVDFHGSFRNSIDEIRKLAIKEAERKQNNSALYAPNQTGNLFELKRNWRRFNTYKYESFVLSKYYSSIKKSNLTSKKFYNYNWKC
jgi:hypothetical protein